jgi:hypothetical protein
MANDLHTAPEPGLASIVGGIVHDAQDLVKQELALAKREFREELRKTKEAAISLGIGVSVASMGGILLVFMVVYLLNWLTADQLPLWACYGLIGGALALIGISLLFLGKSKAEDIHLLPQQTLETMKENLRWTRNAT